VNLQPLFWLFFSVVASSVLALAGVPQPWFLGPVVLVLILIALVNLFL
jgi:hypothetical protein